MIHRLFSSSSRIVKLPALKGKASRKGVFFIVCPFLPAGRDPTLKGGASGAPAGLQGLKSEGRTLLMTHDRLELAYLITEMTPRAKRGLDV
jgi:hypothetical protein